MVASVQLIFEFPPPPQNPQTNLIGPFIAGGGIGVKIPLGPILFRVDTAWDINPNGYSRPQYYISIGTDW